MTGTSDTGRPASTGQSGLEDPQTPTGDMTFGPDRLIMIGASTGGIDALIEVLKVFPVNAPPVMVVQHTGAKSAQGLSRVLAKATRLMVTEAAHGMQVSCGSVYLAPVDRGHLRVSGDRPLFCRLLPGPRVAGHAPSIDVLFQSGIHIAHRISAALLTGMGRDGAEGLLALRKAGASTFCQDKDSSLVYGMPRVAFEMGAAQAQKDIRQLGSVLLSSCQADGLRKP